MHTCPLVDETHLGPSVTFGELGLDLLEVGFFARLRFEGGFMVLLVDLVDGGRLRF